MEGSKMDDLRIAGATAHRRLPGYAVLAALFLTGLAPGCGPTGTAEISEIKPSSQASSGWVDEASVRVHNNASLYEKCYAKALKNTPDAKGLIKVKMEFGVPSYAYLRSNDTGSDELGDCLLNAIPTKFYLGDPPSGSMTISIEFRKQ
jgi:hypothetical protein